MIEIKEKIQFFLAEKDFSKFADISNKKAELVLKNMKRHGYALGLDAMGNLVKVDRLNCDLVKECSVKEVITIVNSWLNDSLDHAESEKDEKLIKKELQILNSERRFLLWKINI